MTEETLVRELDLPEGVDFVWHGDLNLVVLRRGMTCDQRERAIDELQRQWRRAHLRLVETA